MLFKCYSIALKVILKQYLIVCYISDQPLFRDDVRQILKFWQLKLLKNHQLFMLGMKHTHGDKNLHTLLVKAAFIKDVIKFSGFLTPPPPFVVNFTKKGLCYKIVIWLTPPPQLSTWFMNGPLWIVYHNLYKIRIHTTFAFCATDKNICDSKVWGNKMLKPQL